MAPMTLLDVTRELLVEITEEGSSLRAVAPDGGPVEYDWLKKFSAGKIPDPSVNRIQALHDRLLQMRTAQMRATSHSGDAA